MKRILTTFLSIVFIFSLSFFAFSYNIDGIDTGREWDGASVYNLVDGESNCGVDFGVVKVKFDHETRAFLLCFFFSDPNFTADNLFAGISLQVEDAEFEFDASDGIYSQNIEPYSFDGAIHLDINNGVTCEVRVGVKSGLPKRVDCCVRFIDSQGFYSNYYPFTIENDAYEEETGNNSEVSNATDDKTILNNKTKSRRNRFSTTRSDITIKTSPPYSYTGRTKRTTTEKTTKKDKLPATTKTANTQKNNVTVVYYEKEIYISEVYIKKDPAHPLTELTEVIDTYESEHSEITLQTSEINTEKNEISLSKGTKYKKALTVGGLTAFIALACFGVYSAKKASDKSDNGN